MMTMKGFFAFFFVFMCWFQLCILLARVHVSAAVVFAFITAILGHAHVLKFCIRLGRGKSNGR